MDNIVPTPESNLQARSAVTSIDSPTAVTSAKLSSDSAQGYAKGLMDELFGDLDGLLDGTLVPPSEPLKVEDPKPRAPINLDFATFLSTHPSQLSSQLSSQFSSQSSFQSSSVAGFSSVAPELLSIPQDEPVELPPSMAEMARNEARQSSYGVFEKMLIFVGCSSAVAAVMILLGSQGVIGRVWAALNAGSSGASAPANPSDVKFADYMGKTLDSIEAKVKSTQPAANVPGLNSGIPGMSMLPTVKVPGMVPGSKPSSVGSSIVVGGVLRPTSLGNAASTVPSPIPGNVPGVVPANTVQNELNQAVSKLSGLVDRMTNGGRSSVAIAPVAVAPGMTAARAPQPAPVSQAPAPARTLKAVMELGAQSAVLFEMNGVSQRYEKGENIGTSGWVVVKIENGSAIVRRNGEVRTLSVGQKI